MKETDPWLLLVVTLPTSSATPRMRLWRAIKALGCAGIRDGSYILPNSKAHVRALEDLAEQTNQDGGNGWVVEMRARSEEDETAFRNLFDRSTDYQQLLNVIVQAHIQIKDQTPSEISKTGKRLRKELEVLEKIDFFPSESSLATKSALEDFEISMQKILSPNEPTPVFRSIPRLDAKDFQKQVWATRAHLWVDRLASAWLIRRFIDTNPTFKWFEENTKCPTDAIGFDFDDAMFTHVGDKVTFEVLMESFGLFQPALERVAEIVHYIDAGGIPPPEASGIESVLAGLKESVPNDDQFLAMACNVFDGVLKTFEKNSGH